MAEPEHPHLPHLTIRGTAASEKYVPPATGGRESQFPQRNRQAHGKKLLRQLQELAKEAEALGQERTALGIDAQEGICIEFESEPGFDLKLDSLERIRSGIELLAVRQEGNKTFATVFVPEGKLKHFEHLISSYIKEKTQSGKPKHQPVVTTIAGIRKAALEALVRCYAAENAVTPIKANLFNPGPVRTAMRAKAFPGEDPMSLPAPEEMVPLFLELASPQCVKNGAVINFRDWRNMGAATASKNADA